MRKPMELKITKSHLTQLIPLRIATYMTSEIINERKLKELIKEAIEKTIPIIAMTRTILRPVYCMLSSFS